MSYPKEIWADEGGRYFTVHVIACDLGVGLPVKYIHHAEHEALQASFDELAQLSHKYRNDAERLQPQVDRLISVLKIARHEIDSAWRDEGIHFGDDPLVIDKIDAAIRQGAAE